MPVRLINPAANTSTPTEGRLEILYFGLWGTVCDDGFTDVNAQVVCASLGFGYVSDYDAISSPMHTIFLLVR